MTSDEKQVKLAEFSKELFAMRFNDESGIENYFFDVFFQEYLKVSLPLVIEWFDKIFELQKEKKQNYGDIDWSITKIYNKEYVSPKRMIDNPLKPGTKWNVGGSKKLIQALYYDDHCSCADRTTFMIIKETRKIGDRNEVVFHVREVYPSLKGKKLVTYQRWPDLSWYKKRSFNLDYMDEHHAVANAPHYLGGSYGDLRDEGFIFTAKQKFYNDTFEVERGSISRYDYYNMVTRTLAATVSELKHN